MESSHLGRGGLDSAAGDNEEMFRQLAEHIHEVLYVYDSAADRVLFVNPAYEEIWQRPRRQLYADPAAFMEAIAEEDRPRVLEARLQQRRGHHTAVEYRIHRPDGSLRWIEDRTFSVRSNDGLAYRVIGIAEDITVHKLTEQRLREQSAALEAQVEISQELMAERDPGRILRRVLDGARQITGACYAAFIPNPKQNAEHLSTGVLLSGAPLDAFPRLQSMDTGELFRLFFDTGQAVRFESLQPEHIALSSNPLAHPEPGYAPMASYLVVPIISPHEDFLGGLLLGHDQPYHFTEFHIRLTQQLANRASIALDNAQLHAETQAALAKANEATRARDEFLAIVSHELKTPLTPILGWVSMLQATVGQTGGQPTIEHALEVIERSVRSQSQLINDLLDVSSIVTGKLRLDARAIELHPAVEAALETVRPAAVAKGIVLEAVLDRAAGRLKGDPARLQQITWNLLSNAIKFTPPGGRVAVRLEREGSSLRLTVRDDGPGIPPEFLPFIFDRFRQVDSSTTRQHGGLGMGLAIVRHLVEMHGGTATVHSGGPGFGSTFEVRLPLLTEAEYSSLTDETYEGEAALRFAHDVNARTSMNTLEGTRVLLVEDDRDARELLVLMLESYGAEVRATSHASEGYEIIRSWRPDVFLSDIGLPSEDGYSLMRRIRALPESEGGKTPAVALTAYARMEDRFKALAAGFQNHLTKPVEPAELAVTLASVLGRVVG